MILSIRYINELFGKQRAVVVAGCVFSLMLTANAANAQGFKIDKRSLEKSTFYTAPREFQVVDDGPVVKDFREAPSSQAPTIPAGGLHMGDNGVVIPPGPTGSRVSTPDLPKSGFGSASNISRHPGSMLPRGDSTGILGPTQAMSAQPSRRSSPGLLTKPSAGPSRPTTVATYGGGGYSTSSGTSARTESNVHGTLLNQHVRGHLLSH